GDGGRDCYNAANVLSSPTAREAPRELLEALRERPLRDAATRVLRDKWEATGLPLTKEQAVEVKALAKDKDEAVRCTSVWILYCSRLISVKEVVGQQRESLKASDPWVRRQAVRFLGKLGSHSKDAIEDLTALLKDDDEGVRQAAAEALKRIR